MANLTLIHATAVAYQGQAALILGASGSGKSALALQLIALGCTLVADDQVALAAPPVGVMVSRPEGLPAKIEARGVGLLSAPMAEQARLRLCVDMDDVETQRLPEERYRDVLGHDIKVIRKSETPHFPAAILLYLKAVPESQQV